MDHADCLVILDDQLQQLLEPDLADAEEHIQALQRRFRSVMRAYPLHVGIEAGHGCIVDELHIWVEEAERAVGVAPRQGVEPVFGNFTSRTRYLGGLAHLYLLFLVKQLEPTLGRVVGSGHAASAASCCATAARTRSVSGCAGPKTS